MKNLLYLWLLALLPLSASITHVEVTTTPDQRIWEYSMESARPFTELMISWDATRPSRGDYTILVSLEEGQWLPYAEWGAGGQRTFSAVSRSGHSRTYQDAASPVGEAGQHLAVRVEAKGGASLDQFERIHLSLTHRDDAKPGGALPVAASTVNLGVAGISQMAIDHPRADCLCSPTSTCAAVCFLGEQSVDPAEFADRVWDSGFDIYGNWVFNTAEASQRLGPGWQCWVERLAGLPELYNHLAQGVPVVVSVRGPLEGSAKPYESGHLILVIGYDAEQQQILCMDPAFPDDELTVVRYDATDFATAWERRGFVAYLFAPVPR